MIFSSRSSQRLSPGQREIVRAHWEWAGGYALLWIVVTIMIFGIFLMREYSGVDENVRTQSLVLLATITIVNAIWRAAGALAARIESILTRQRHEKPNS